MVAYQQDLARLVRSGFKPSVKEDVKSDFPVSRVGVVADVEERSVPITPLLSNHALLDPRRIYLQWNIASDNIRRHESHCVDIMESLNKLLGDMAAAGIDKTDATFSKSSEAVSSRELVCGGNIEVESEGLDGTDGFEGKFFFGEARKLNE
ncbi:hypothetical protein SLS57_010344 [Botryosphaeria dothidea]